jgi:hypothetical protein
MNFTEDYVVSDISVSMIVYTDNDDNIKKFRFEGKDHEHLDLQKLFNISPDDHDKLITNIKKISQNIQLGGGRLVDINNLGVFIFKYYD